MTSAAVAGAYRMRTTEPAAGSSGAVRRVSRRWNGQLTWCFSGGDGGIRTHSDTCHPVPTNAAPCR